MRGLVEKVRTVLMGAEQPKEDPAEVAADVLNGARNDLFKSGLLVVGLTPDHRFIPSDDNVIQLQIYLNAVFQGRKSNFTAEEMTRKGVFPPRQWWVRVALLRWACDLVRGDDPVGVSEMYRDREYNDANDGAPKSAHIHCCAIDLDFPSRKAWMYALGVLCKIYNSPVNFGIGLGVGDRRIHIDFFSPTWTRNGQRPRYWKYASCPGDFTTPEGWGK